MKAFGYTRRQKNISNIFEASCNRQPDSYELAKGEHQSETTLG
jgi:hypothetical protein